jgi:hypothetical protein
VAMGDYIFFFVAFLFLSKKNQLDFTTVLIGKDDLRVVFHYKL